MEKNIYDNFVSCLSEYLVIYKVRNRFDPSTVIGPCFVQTEESGREIHTKHCKK
ncbi:hypothetical protein [Caldifermentibacillus hisashii]|uniref:hypothetical protein n=1 Tax=Caldifermentibacillus hisashii TaxID=996558 RepID=UPI003BF788EF